MTKIKVRKLIWDSYNLEHIKKHAVRVNEVYFAVNNLAYHKQTYNKR